jgi:hypothetical protein
MALPLMLLGAEDNSRLYVTKFRPKSLYNLVINDLFFLKMKKETMMTNESYHPMKYWSAASLYLFTKRVTLHLSLVLLLGYLTQNVKSCNAAVLVWRQVDCPNHD